MTKFKKLSPFQGIALLFLLLFIPVGFYFVSQKKPVTDMPPKAAEVSCNMTTNPPRLCPYGYDCASKTRDLLPPLAGSDGTCIPQTKIMCGGLRGLSCPNGFTCDYGTNRNKTPDASGTCVKITEKGVTDAGCVRTGCSGQLCKSENSGGGVSTCEWRDIYRCAQLADCKIQTDGSCKLVDNSSSTSCYSSFITPTPTNTPTSTPTRMPTNTPTPTTYTPPIRINTPTPTTYIAPTPTPIRIIIPRPLKTSTPTPTILPMLLSDLLSSPTATLLPVLDITQPILTIDPFYNSKKQVNPTLSISGTSDPEAELDISIFPDTITTTVTVDSLGNWEYALPNKLTNGDKQLTIISRTASGGQTTKIETFTVVGGYRFPFAGVVFSLLIAFGVGGYLIYKKKMSKNQSPPPGPETDSTVPIESHQTEPPPAIPPPETV